MELHFNITPLLVCLLSIICDTLATAQNMSTNKSSFFVIESNNEFPYTVIAYETSELNFNYSFTDFNASNRVDIPPKGWTISVSVDDERIVEVEGLGKLDIEPQSPSGNFSIFLKGSLPGRTKLRFAARSSGKNASHYEDVTFRLLSERKERPLDVAFTVVVIILVCLTNIGMGAKVDLNVVKSELKRPVAPIVGLSSQFIFMPLIAFVVAYNMELDPGIALGLFALGCSPGGSASNAYTYLLNGNVSLSVTMTLISTFAALGFLPMWLFSLGTIIYRDGEVEVPFENIFISLLGIVIPVVIGLVLQRKFPRAAEFMIKAVKYLVLVFILFVLTVGVYANLYIFSLLSGEVLLASALLPYLGFIFGGLLAWATRRTKANIIAIAVETGIQNTGIPIVLLRLSLSGPDKDTGIVSPVASAIFTPLPLCIGIVYVQVKMFLEKRREAKEAREHEGGFVYKDSEHDMSHESGSHLIVRNGDV